MHHGVVQPAVHPLVERVRSGRLSVAFLFFELQVRKPPSPCKVTRGGIGPGSPNASNELRDRWVSVSGFEPSAS